MADIEGTPPPEPDAPGRRVPPAAIWMGIVAVIAVIIALVVLLGGDDGDDATDATTTVATTPSETTDTTETTTTDETTTTTVDEPTATVDDTTTTIETTTTAVTETTVAVPDEFASAVWPWFASDVRYDDPVEAARGFAEEFLGMTDPIVGEFLAGDLRSGEVEVRSIETFTPTLVSVRLLGDDGAWWVTGSSTPNILVDEPSWNDAIGSPLVVAGRAVAFEGTVEVLIVADGIDEPIFTDFVTAAGGPGDPGPFEDEFEWANPGTGSGSLVFRTVGSEDDRVLEATVMRVRFAAN